jgi:hypothetical protein
MAFAMFCQIVRPWNGPTFQDTSFVIEDQTFYTKSESCFWHAVCGYKSAPLIQRNHFDNLIVAGEKSEEPESCGGGNCRT